MKLIDVFGDSGQVKLIQFILKTKGNLMNLSEIARRTNLANSTVSRLVDDLIKLGVVKEIKVGSLMRVVYLAEDHPLTRLLLDFQSKLEGLNKSGLS
ncbi:MAG: helix-turn-helix domain-containing protein [Candidatus Odinarchaeum yellowstonii]|jgi:DNA-binding MarR family transcriptional regulator|uniref:Helix-turn-helix domain-containing protein n=1 Tax=Odinarchaeota yellowstonii (strain LCB_4) TaxID=1841599 RepID=A0AAF0D163_ODILC|nr:MAG: helix-turn-helix domain-containing protein [Candidatus Odinarchaeum yellowstonii]